MNERIKRLCEQSKEYANESTKDFTGNEPVDWMDYYTEKFAELIVRECANICMEMSAKCAGLPGDGALAKDCAYWIKKDFGVEE